jgi:hypothetical protein
MPKGVGDGGNNRAIDQLHWMGLNLGKGEMGKRSAFNSSGSASLRDLGHLTSDLGMTAPLISKSGLNEYPNRTVHICARVKKASARKVIFDARQKHVHHTTAVFRHLIPQRELALATADSGDRADQKYISGSQSWTKACALTRGLNSQWLLSALCKSIRNDENVYVLLNYL